MDGYCLLKKVVDPSVLRDGFTIPAAFQEIFYKQIGFTMTHGETRQITLLCDGQEYNVKLTNTDFDRNRFDHIDILQIRYTPKSPIAVHFRQVFADTWGKVQAFYAARTGTERYKPDNEDCEYLAIYATAVPGTFMADCITSGEYREESAELSKMDELTFENVIDRNATIETRTVVKKVRRLTKAIGDGLKVVYGYRCQICGQYIGEQYGSNVIHAHHIDYFTKSMNNNADNIMIVCPNHHAIIHDRNPEFDRSRLQYHYPNGYVEGLKLNEHLKWHL